MRMSFPLTTARGACVDSIEEFLQAADGISEYDLLGASRCHGWSRLDVVVHVVAGWQEMLGGMVSPVDTEQTVDAASFWPAFAAEYSSKDPVPTLMAQRRRTAGYARPAAAIEQMHDVAAGLLRGVEGLPDRCVLWLGHVFTPGDYLGVWAVENVIHQLDLLSDSAAPASALGLARASVEGIVGAALPTDWDDEQATLIGSGRLPVPDGGTEFAELLPALG